MFAYLGYQRYSKKTHKMLFAHIGEGNMKNVAITLSEYPFDTYFRGYSVSAETQHKLETVDVLILPSPQGQSQYYFSQEAINFVKYCRQSNNVNIDVLADYGAIEVLSLHSFDIWMPIIWIAENILFPVIVGLVTNYVYERMRGKEKEKCEVKVVFMVKSGENVKELRYEGDAKTFEETFKKIDINKL